MTSGRGLSTFTSELCTLLLLTLRREGLGWCLADAHRFHLDRRMTQFQLGPASTVCRSSQHAGSGLGGYGSLRRQARGAGITQRVGAA